MAKTPEQIYDELLVLRCQGGDPRAFEELVTRWQMRIWRHAYHMIGQEDAAWDVVQNTWVGIIKRISRLRDVASFPRWAFRIASNKCADWVRREQERRRGPEAPAQEREHRVEEGLRRNVAYENLTAALELLPAQQRALLSLRHVEGFGTAEIAEVLGIPEGTVKPRLHNAREQLRELMERVSDE